MVFWNVVRRSRLWIYRTGYDSVNCMLSERPGSWSDFDPRRSQTRLKWRRWRRPNILTCQKVDMLIWIDCFGCMNFSSQKKTDTWDDEYWRGWCSCFVSKLLRNFNSMPLIMLCWLSHFSIPDGIFQDWWTHKLLVEHLFGQSGIW